jgi:hypothetical protein
MLLHAKVAPISLLQLVVQRHRTSIGGTALRCRLSNPP